MKYVFYVVGEVGKGEWPTLFRLKTDAEEFARQLFPDESPTVRYSRVMCRIVEG